MKSGHDQQESLGEDQEVVECKCECCGLEEECTKAYMKQVRTEHYGKWVCGLCAQAVEEGSRRIRRSPEEALQAHMTECKRFNHNCATTTSNTFPPTTSSPVALWAAAMTRILRRSFSNASSTAVSLKASSPSPEDTSRIISRSSTCISSLPRHCSTAL